MPVQLSTENLHLPLLKCGMATPYPYVLSERSLEKMWGAPERPPPQLIYLPEIAGSFPTAPVPVPGC